MIARLLTKPRRMFGGHSALEVVANLIERRMRVKANAEVEEELRLELQAVRAAHTTACARLAIVDGRQPGEMYCEFCGRDKGACRELITMNLTHGPCICDVCAYQAADEVTARLSSLQPKEEA